MLYSVGNAVTSTCLHTFFRDIEVIGLQNVPRSGPVILYANHNNQFADALLMIQNCPRTIRFITAEKSMSRFVVGDFARAFGVIPVKRQEDAFQRVPGRVQAHQDRLQAVGQCDFSKMAPGGLVRLDGIKKDFTLVQIGKKWIRLSERLPEGDYQLKYAPKLSHSDLYSNVWTKLAEGNCIGIFPEGGSHDNTQLLPLKAGIVIMALGAAQNFGINPVIVPCGFNYFNQDKFRSKVVIQFGQGFTLAGHFLQQYILDRKSAIKDSLCLVEQRLKEVTLLAPSFDLLKTLFLMRQMYLSDVGSVCTKHKLEVVRNFNTVYSSMQPSGQEVFKQAQYYRRQLQSLGLTDKAFIAKDSLPIQGLSLAISFIRLLFCLVLGMPGIALYSPIVVVIRRLSERERLRCLRESQVKVEAKDVVASYKLVLGIVLLPLYALLMSFLVAAWLQYAEVESSRMLSWLFLVLQPALSVIAIRSLDGIMAHSKKLKSKLSCLFNRDSHRSLMRVRTDLRRQILQMIESKMLPVIRQARVEKTEDPLPGLVDINLDQLFNHLTDMEYI